MVDDFNICRYDSGLKGQLIDFLGLLWEDTDIHEREKRFDWTYENNPYSKKPFIYIILNGERVVAVRPFTIQKFIYDECEFLLGVPADAIVHPEFRRMGLFSRLTKFALEDMQAHSDIKFLLSLSSNEKSTSGNIKTGFIPIGKRENLYQFSPINRLKNILQGNIELNDPVLSKKNDLEIEITKELHIQEISDFIQTFSDKYKIHNMRDKEFYKWRFADSPHAYIYVYCRSNEEATGYLILRNIDNKSYKLMEYGYSKLPYLQFMVDESLKQLLIPVVVVPTFTRSQEELTILKKSGFFNVDDKRMAIMKTLKLIKAKNYPGALIRPISPVLDETAYFIDRIDTRVSKNWSLFQSDVW